MEQALKLSWFFLHSTVVPNNDQHQQQTPAFIPRHQTAAIMTDHSPSSRPSSTNSKVAAQQMPPPPGGAVFGGYAHHATSRPAFLSPPTIKDASLDSRDEIGGQPTTVHQQYPPHSPPSAATFGVSSASIAAEFSPPRSTALRTAPSHDSADGSTTDQYLTEPMPALPSVPPSSSVLRHGNSPQQVHVTFAPPAIYHTYEHDPRFGYQYESYQYPPAQATSTVEQQRSTETLHHTAHPRNSNDDDDQSTPYEGTTVPDDEVTSRDIKFGRGGGTNRHPGNLFFRKLVEDAKPAYMLAKKTEKGRISRSIVATIRNRGGRWLKFDQHSDLWVDVGDDEATKKVSQALREGLALKRREALMKSVSTSGSRSKKSIARPAYMSSSKAKCSTNAKKNVLKE